MLLLSLLSYQFKAKIKEKLRKFKYLNRSFYIYCLYIFVIGFLIFDIAVPKVDAQDNTPVLALAEIETSLNATTKEHMFGNNTEVADDNISKKITAIEDKVVSTGYVLCSAYNSVSWQTDSTPCITANGYNVCEANKENVIAANFLRFGTKVRFPDYFGDRVFTVQDRMNKRYTYKVDFWMTGDTDQKAIEKAINFGIRKLRMEILE